PTHPVPNVTLCYGWKHQRENQCCEEDSPGPHAFLNNVVPSDQKHECKRGRVHPVSQSLDIASAVSRIQAHQIIREGNHQLRLAPVGGGRWASFCRAPRGICSDSRSPGLAMHLGTRGCRRLLALLCGLSDAATAGAGWMVLCCCGCSRRGRIETRPQA